MEETTMTFLLVFIGFFLVLIANLEWEQRTLNRLNAKEKRGEKLTQEEMKQPSNIS